MTLDVLLRSTCTDWPQRVEWKMLRNNYEDVEAFSSCSNGNLSAAQSSFLLYLLLMVKCAPPHYLSGWASFILRPLNQSPSDAGGTTLLNVLAIDYLRRMAEVPPKEYTVNFAGAAFMSWLSLSLLETDSTELCELVVCLEMVLARLLSRDAPSLVSASLHALVVNQAENIVRRCIRTMSRVKSFPTQERNRYFLVALLRYDQVAFAPALLWFISSSDGVGDLVTLINSGLMDESLSLALQYKVSSNVYYEARLRVSKLVLQRAITLLDDPMRHPAQIKSVLSTIRSISEQDKQDTAELFAQLARSITKLFFREPPCSRLEHSLWEVIFRFSISLSKSGTIDNEGNARGTMLGIIFLDAFNRLPRNASVYLTENDISRYHTVAGSIEELLQYPHVIQFPLLKDWDMIGSSTISCLKIGLHPVQRQATVFQIACLRLVMLLVRMSAESDSLPISRLLSRMTPPLSSQVFRVMTSHSNLTAILGSQEEGQRSEQRVLVLQILHTCLLRTECISFQKSLWEALLQGFGAGVTLRDNLTRRVLELYGGWAPQVWNSFSLWLYCPTSITLP